MQSIVFRRALPLVFVISATAGGQAPPVPVEVTGWFGILTVFEERLVVDASVVAVGDLTLMVGSVKGEGGENMAFLIPTSGEGLISSTWAITSIDQDHPSTLWSDGNCLLLDLRSSEEPGSLVERAPWLAWGTRTSDVTLLSFLQKTEGRGWATQEVFFGLRGFHPDGEAEAEDLGEVISESSKDPSMLPKLLQDNWDEIAFRYIETRDRLRRVDALRIVGGSDPPAESAEIVQP